MKTKIAIGFTAIIAGAAILFPELRLLALAVIGLCSAVIWLAQTLSVAEDEEAEMDTDDYDMPDWQRDMPEFAPIGGYKFDTPRTDGPKKPRLSLVEELSLDKYR